MKELLKLSSLRKLSLVSLNLGDGGAAELCISLKESMFLRSLELVSTQISQVGAFSLACSIEEIRALEDLNVAGNQLDDEGSLRLTHSAIKSNLRRLRHFK